MFVMVKEKQHMDLVGDILKSNSPQNKLKVQNQIKEFLDWYQDLKWR